ncbi:MAG: P-II family nitrogen regulator [Erysipelotrichaceae bacterium]|nr:P-II family nitrogen regulator [Erysipelotrichaceae bacterium]MDY5252566.1 P-II family nitrogen regulator [Erysipelotrichaceae bacterium]
MKCLFIVLNDTEKLDDLLEALGNNGIKGATVIESTGMAHRLMNNDYSTRFLGSLRNILNPERETNNTIFMVLTDEQIEQAKLAIREVLGDISKPDTAIIFSLPVDFIEGVRI